MVTQGSFACGELPDGPPRAVCEAVAAGSDGAKLEGAARDPVAWVAALRHQDAGRCDAISQEEERVACRAAANGDISACPLSRPTIEQLDRDYSCRDVLLDSREHATGSGWEVAFTLGASFHGKAECDVLFRQVLGGRERVEKVLTVDVAGPIYWKDFHHQTGPFRVHKVQVKCRWDPETSRSEVKSVE